MPLIRSLRFLHPIACSSLLVQILSSGASAQSLGPTYQPPGSNSTSLLRNSVRAVNALNLLSNQKDRTEVVTEPPKAASLGTPVEITSPGFDHRRESAQQDSVPPILFSSVGSTTWKNSIQTQSVQVAADQFSFKPIAGSLHQFSPAKSFPISQVPKNTSSLDVSNRGDPELSVIWVQAQSAPQTEPTGEKEQNTICDPELGCLRLQPSRPPATQRQPVVYLIPRLDFFNSDNIFSLAADRNPIGDSLIRPGLTLFANPLIGNGTYLVTSVTGNFIRYVNEGQYNYNELLFRAGIFRVLSRQMSGELGWSNQQLFIASNDLQGFNYGERFLNDQVLRLELNRLDQLSKSLSLRSFYQFRVGFAQPTDLSRIGNTLFLSLGYNITPGVQAGLDYLFFLANYTQQQRQDLYHQISARITYNAFQNFQINIFAGYSFGSSTAPGVDYDGFTLGFNLNLNLEIL